MHVELWPNSELASGDNCLASCKSSNCKQHVFRQQQGKNIIFSDHNNNIIFIHKSKHHPSITVALTCCVPPLTLF